MTGDPRLRLSALVPGVYREICRHGLIQSDVRIIFSIYLFLIIVSAFQIAKCGYGWYSVTSVRKQNHLHHTCPFSATAQDNIKVKNEDAKALAWGDTKPAKYEISKSAGGPADCKSLKLRPIISVLDLPPDYLSNLWFRRRILPHLSLGKSAKGKAKAK